MLRRKQLLRRQLLRAKVLRAVQADALRHASRMPGMIMDNNVDSKLTNEVGMKDWRARVRVRQTTASSAKYGKSTAKYGTQNLRTLYQ